MAVAQAQRVRTSTLSTTQSLSLVKNLVRLSVSTVCYLRGLFGDDAFTKIQYMGMAMTVLRKQDPADADTDSQTESQRKATLLAQWLERGVFAALEKRYLRTFALAVYAGGDTLEECDLLECYTYNVTYPEAVGYQFSLNTSGHGLPQVEVSASDKASMKDQMLLTLRTLITMCGTLPTIPRTHFITFKLLYHDDITPKDWQPPFFSDADEDAWPLAETGTNSLDIQMGRLATPFHTLALKVSVPTSAREQAPTRVAPPAKNRKKDPQHVAQTTLHPQRTTTAPAPAGAALDTHANVTARSQRDAGSEAKPQPPGGGSSNAGERAAAKLLLQVTCMLAESQLTHITAQQLQEQLDMSSYGAPAKQLKVARHLLKRLEDLGYLKKALRRKQGRVVLRDKLATVASRARARLDKMIRVDSAASGQTPGSHSKPTQAAEARAPGPAAGAGPCGGSVGASTTTDARPSVSKRKRGPTKDSHRSRVGRSPTLSAAPHTPDQKRRRSSSLWLKRLQN